MKSIKKNAAKVSAMAMAAAMMMSMSAPAFAAVSNNTTSEAAQTYYNEDDDYAKADVDDAYTGYNSGDEDKQGDTEVEVVQASTLKITIPKKIVLNGARGGDNSATYDVTVNDGNIPGDVVVNIVPKGDDGGLTFKMTEAGGKKKDLTATITPGDTSWTITDDGTGDAECITDATHEGNSVSVANLSAGEFSGTFNFDISIDAATTDAENN